MRGVLLSLAVVLVVAGTLPRAASAPVLTGGASVSPSASYEWQNPGKDISVDINLNRGVTPWYRSPVWIAIGVLALVILILIIVLATRGGGGTTIVKG
jgi:hypothetical protein